MRFARNTSVAMPWINAPIVMITFQVSQPRPAQHAGDVHGVKGQVKPNHEQPKVKFPKRFMQHPAGDLGIPVVNCAEDTKQDSAYDHIMKVRDNEVRTAELPVKWRGADHDAGKAGDQKLEQECDAEQHRGLELDFAAPHGAQPVENLDASRNRD